MTTRKRVPKKLSRIEIITLRMLRDIFINKTYRYFTNTVNNEEGD